MPTVTSSQSLSTLEAHIKHANQAIQLKSIARNLKALDGRLERAPNLDRARYYFLKGVLYTKAALLDRVDVKLWLGSDAEALIDATKQFAECVKMANAVRSNGTDAPTLVQLTILERIATFEWAVAYTTLRSRKEEIDQEFILSMECLGPASRKQILRALERGRRIESRFFRL